jgi:hypothetical protein
MWWFLGGSLFGQKLDEESSMMNGADFVLPAAGFRLFGSFFISNTSFFILHFPVVLRGLQQARRPVVKNFQTQKTV